MQIDFDYELNFKLKEETKFRNWITEIIHSENKVFGPICYIFMSDEDLKTINIDYLNHDYFTDIITFNYCEGDTISGDIFISVDRIKDNANIYKVPFLEELLRVMAHGILHLCGYNDKTELEIKEMRNKEIDKIKLFHVERT